MVEHPVGELFFSQLIPYMFLRVQLGRVGRQREVVDPEYVEVLAEHYGKRVGPIPSVLTFYMQVARLGGHQNRKGDGFPGWLTLWRGWMKLQSMVDGYRAGRRQTSTRCGKT